MPLVGVILDAAGLVGTAEADQVGREHAVPGFGQRRNHGAVQVTPRGLAVQQHDRRAVDGPLVEEVHAQRWSAAGGHVEVVSYERVTLQVFESRVWGSQHIHEFSSSGGRFLHRPGECLAHSRYGLGQNSLRSSEIQSHVPGSTGSEDMP